VKLVLNIVALATILSVGGLTIGLMAAPSGNGNDCLDQITRGGWTEVDGCLAHHDYCIEEVRAGRPRCQSCANYFP